MDILSEINNYDEFSAGVKQKLTAFYTMIQDFQSAFNKMDLSAFIGYVLDKSGYIRDLKENEDETTAETKIDNLQEFLSVAKEFVPQDNDVLGEFLSQVSLVSDIDSYVDDSNALTLMTLHSAKGLEFDTVFLSGLEEGTFPHSRSLDAPNEMEEERRLMYVGITRAKQNLYLSYAKRRKMWGDYKSYKPKRLEENADGSIKATTSFGKNFVAPQKRATHNTSFVVKSKNNQINKEEREKREQAQIQNLLENNPIKKMLLEKKQREAQMESEKKETEKSVSQEIKTSKNGFSVGERVFHSKFGVGKITDIQTIGSSEMLIADFGNQGKKALDSSFSQLKKF